MPGERVERRLAAVQSPTFDLDLAAVEAAIGPKTRLVIVNTPYNPTGRIYSRASLEALLADLLERASGRIGHRILLLSDELRLRPILALNFCNYACTLTVQGLWGGPFLREVHGLSPIEAGNVLLVAVIAYQASILAFGPLDRLLDTRKWIAIGGSVMIISILATLAN